MKRFRITTGDGHTLRLCYPSLETAKERYPDAEIVEDNDQSHVAYIQRMIEAAAECQTVERNGSIVYLLRFETSVGTCFAMLSKDSNDGVWYDLCKYQLWKTGAVVLPFGWKLSNPVDFCKRFLFQKAEYIVLSSGRNHKKPKELCGIRKFASVSFGKCKCQLFLKGDDLYINHHDYFSRSWRPPDDDIGKPTTYYLKKYFGIIKPEKFCYADCWGDIVLQNKAWLQINNFIPMVKILNASQIAQVVWVLIREYYKWPSYERNMDWERFLEDIANVTKSYLDREVT